MATVIALASAGTAIDLGDQLSATPLPILETTPTVPEYDSNVDPSPTTPAGVVPDAGGGSSVDEDPIPDDEDASAPSPSAGVKASTGGTDGGEDAGEAGSDDGADASGASPMPTYGGTLYSKKAASTSSSSGSRLGSSLGSAAGSAVAGATDSVDGAVGAASGASSGAGATDTQASNESAAPQTSFTAVPGPGAGVTGLALLGLAVVTARRLKR